MNFDFPWIGVNTNYLNKHQLLQLLFAMLGSASLLIIALVVFVFYLITHAKNRHDNFPPGPPKLPIWGSYWFMLKENYHHAHLALEALGKRYKTDILGVYLGEFPCVVTFSNELCKELLTREEFIGRNDTVIIRARNLGELKGIFFVDQNFWKHERRFSLRHLRDYGFGRRSQFVENFITDEIKNLIDFLNDEPSFNDLEICRRKGEILIPDVFYGTLLNSILLLLTSKKFDDGILRKCANAGLRFQRSGDATGAAISMTPWLRFVAPDFFGYTSAVKDTSVMLSFLKECLDEHLKTFSDDYHRDFTDDYISETIKNGNKLDYKQLWLTLLDYMFPAPIAIGHTLSFYFAHLINNPEVQLGIQKEIDSVVGRSRLPNLDDRKFMPYTEASIRENIRILPLNPLGIPRRCVKDTTLAGYFIPKDTIMLPCVWTAHKDAKVWEEPDKFLPERFLDQNGDLIKKDLTIGFGAGKRLCAGETFSRQNMFLIISGLVQNFTFASPTGKSVDLNDIVPGVNLSLRENWVKAIPR